MEDVIGNLNRKKVEEVDIPPIIGPYVPLSLSWSTTGPPLILHYSSIIPYFQAFSITSFAYLPLPLKQMYALVNPWTADDALRTLGNPDWREWNVTFIYLVLIYLGMYIITHSDTARKVYKVITHHHITSTLYTNTPYTRKACSLPRAINAMTFVMNSGHPWLRLVNWGQLKRNTGLMVGSVSKSTPQRVCVPRVGNTPYSFWDIFA